MGLLEPGERLGVALDHLVHLADLVPRTYSGPLLTVNNVTGTTPVRVGI